MPTAGFTLGTPVASTSGTSIDFTGIPSGTKQIIVGFDGVSVSGTSKMMIQIGDASGVATTGYKGDSHFHSGTTTNVTTGFTSAFTGAAADHFGQAIITLTNLSTNTWVCTGSAGHSTGTGMVSFAGGKALSAELDRIRVTTIGGSDTFDLGSLNITYI